MAITRRMTYVTSDGKTFLNDEDASKHEIDCLAKSTEIAETKLLSQLADATGLGTHRGIVDYIWLIRNDVMRYIETREALQKELDRL